MRSKAKETNEQKEKESILVVDNDQELLETLIGVLEEKGYRVTGAGDGRKALEKIKETPFDVVLLDVRMPGWSGTETLRKMREIPQGQYSKVIMMTAYTSEAAPIQALKVGVINYIRKPFGLEEFLHSVEKAVDLIKLERERNNYFLELQVNESKLEEETNELKKLQGRYKNLITSLSMVAFSETKEKERRIKELLKEHEEK